MKTVCSYHDGLEMLLIIGVTFTIRSREDEDETNVMEMEVEMKVGEVHINYGKYRTAPGELFSSDARRYQKPANTSSFIINENMM